MYTPDLATECQVASGDAVRAIGWLEIARPYPTGVVDPAFLAALERHIDDPGRWLAVVSCGVHFCDLGGCSRTGGTQHVIIPAQTRVYVAPDLVAHYIAGHHYAPPQEFVDAVLACPEQSSDAFVDLLVPFASVWDLDARSVRRVAARARAARVEHAETMAREAANRGNFRW